jgi:hypothetical protein
MTTLGSQTAATGISSPSGISSIIGVIAAISASHTGATTLCTVFLRLAGQGIIGGEQQVTIGHASGGLTTSGFAVAQGPPAYVPLAIQCTASSTVTMNFDTDTGGTFPARLDVCATLIFQ